MVKKKSKSITVDQFFKICQGKTINQIVKLVCGEKIGEGLHRDVYVCRQHPDFVVKIEKNPGFANFANVSEWRNYVNNREWKFLGPWLAPCVLINETGQVLIQRRVRWEGKRRKDYPLYVPAMLTDLKLQNFGWIGDRFVCCDYSFIALGTRVKLKYAKWWGSLKK